MPIWSLTGLQNIDTQSSLLPSVCPRKANLWMDIIYQLLDRYLWPDPVWHCDCAFSRSIWLRDTASCPVECFPVFPNISLSGDSRTHLKIIILIISLSHWLLSLSLLSSLLSLYFQTPSDCHYGCCHYPLPYSSKKTPIMFLCRLHKAFTICYIYESFCWQNTIFES